MAIVEIELNIESQGSSNFEVSTVLSGQSYKIILKWSVRSMAWYMQIDDTIQGIKLVNGVDMLAPYKYIDALPPGKLGVFRNSGNASKPGFFNLGIEKEMTLLYEEP